MSGSPRPSLRGARRVGAEPALRAAQRALEGKTRRRNRRDDEHLALLFAFALAPDANCIDVGANVGDVLADIVRVAPVGRHIAYEPLPELAAELARRFPDVDVRNAALSDHRGEVEFFRVRGAPSQSGFRTESGATAAAEPLAVAVEPLDEALSEGFVPTLIKIDVEGAEGQVLEGAIETLARHRPIVALEHGDAAARYGTTHADVHALLCDRADLRVFDMDGGGPYSRQAFEEACASGARWNWVARYLAAGRDAPRPIARDLARSRRRRRRGLGRVAGGEQQRPLRGWCRGLDVGLGRPAGGEAARAGGRSTARAAGSACGWTR